MRELSIQSQGLSQACLGKITWHKPWLKAQDYILVTPKATKPSRALLTLSTAPQAAQSRGMAYITPEQLEMLQEGDVVLVEPKEPHPEDTDANSDARLVVLLDTGSKSNYLSLTDRCNHRCIMCPQPPVTKEPSRLAQNLRLIALMSKDTHSIGITGGEPTVVGDDLITVLRALKKRVPQAAITILTNAVKLSDRNLVHQIACCQCADLQIDVPLFASTPELHNEIVGAKTFYKTIQGLYNLASYRIDIGIRVVIHRLNYQHLTALSYFIYHNFPFVKQVAFMQMETMGYAADNIKRLWIDPYDYKDELSVAVNFLRQRRMTALIYNAQLCVLNPDVRDVAVQSISEWKNITLDTCAACARRAECPGFFASNAQFHSAHIHALSV